MLVCVYIADAGKNFWKPVFEICIQHENQWLSFVAQQPCCRLWVMPEWGSNTHVENYGCSCPFANGVSSGLRRLRRRADGNADSAGDACFCGYADSGAYSRTDASTNPSAYSCAYAGAHTHGDACAYTDCDAETHADGNSYANVDAGTHARTYEGQQRCRRGRANPVHGPGIRPAYS